MRAKENLHRQKEKNNLMASFTSHKKAISYVGLVIFVAVFAILGVHFINGSHADTTTQLYTGKLIGINAYTNDVPTLNQLGANSERGEIDFNGSSFEDPNYDGTSANWVNTLTSNNIVPLPMFNQYIEISNINASQFATAVANWCKTYCAGGTYYSQSPKPGANPAYAPQVLEILNEPYGNWWQGNFGTTAYPNKNPTTADMAAYAALLQDVRNDLNSSSIGMSNIKILGAAQVLYDNGFTAQVAADGGYKAVQGLAIHPYGPDPSPAPLLPATASLSGAQGNGGNGWDLVYYLHQQYNLDAYITEDGWCINVNSTTCGDSGNIPEAEKDANIADAISQVATVPWIQGFWYFNLTPYDGNTYGLDDANGNKTSAWTSYQSAAASAKAQYPSEFTLSTSTTPTPTPPSTPPPPPSDTTPPTVSISAPANNATVSGTSTAVSATASDNVGVASVQFQLDGTNLGSAITKSPYTYTWDTTKVANGSHKLTAIAYDAAGNQGNATAVTVTVNNTTAVPTPPTPPATPPTTVQNFAWNAAAKTLTWSAYPGAAAYTIATVHNPTTTRNTDYTWPPVTGTSYKPPTLAGETVNYGIIPLVKNSDGSYSAVTGSTWASEISVIWPAIADTTAPTKPANLTAKTVSSSQINLSWTASTDNVGVTGYQIYRSGSTTPIATVTTPSYGDSGLSAGTSYSYYVVAVDAAGNHSLPSTIVSATTQASVTATTIQGVVTSSRTGKPISGAHMYTDSRATASGAVSTYTNSSGQYVLTGITANSKHTYYYQANHYHTKFYYLQLPAGTTTKNVAL